ncbi:MAG: cation:proton antiporter, partial [Acidobacteriota bacterium]
MAPCERWLGDALRGDRIFFGSEAGVEAAWRLVDPILQTVSPHLYDDGSWGPLEAEALAADAGGWIAPDTAGEGSGCLPRHGHPVNVFDTAAILVATAAVCGYANHRLLRLPPTSGTLLVALVSSLIVVGIERLVPALDLRPVVEGFLSQIDFNQTLLHGLLCFLLFAGALHVDLDGLITERWIIAGLATVGMLISVTIVGALTWLIFTAIGVHVSLLACFIFGALISPTDPIAVMGLLKELRAPASLEAQIAGESLFNDGVGVVVFMGLASMAHLGGSADLHAPGPGGLELILFAVREVAGGSALGLVVGYIGYLALKSIDDHSLELLITLGMVMFLYALSFWIHVSGPIAVVVAGLFIGNPGRRLAMSDRTREHIDAFWRMIDEVLNAVLFLLLGLEVLAVPDWSEVLLPALATVPICLLARLASVAVPVAAMRVSGPVPRGLVPI